MFILNGWPLGLFEEVVDVDVDCSAATVVPSEVCRVFQDGETEICVGSP